ncbi:MAG: Gldg family protein [Chloroflexi bacterium]|nr:Gldg family protein [Chloroflexota bacterium]
MRLPRVLSLPRLPFLADLGLALGAVALLALVAGGLLYLLVPELKGWSLGLIGASGVLLLLFLLFSYREVAQFLGTRRGRYGLNTLVVVSTLGLIVGIANFVGYNQSYRQDLTATSLFTLNSRTIRALDDLADPVTAFAFFPLSQTNPLPASGETTMGYYAAGLLREYSLRSKLFSYRVVDPEQDPTTAAKFNVVQYPSVVFSSGARSQLTTDVSEQSFTAALLRAVGQELKTVCYLTGISGRSSTDASDAGYSSASDALVQENYVVREVSLGTTDEKVPEVCWTIVVAQPGRDLTDSEAALLHEYLDDRKGSALFLLEPEMPGSFTSFLAEYGIEAGGGVVLDGVSRVRQDQTRPAAQPDQHNVQHVITAPLSRQSKLTFYPLATRAAPVDPNPEPQRIALTSLVRTSLERSWLETGGEDPKTAEAGPKDIRGPISIATAALVKREPSGSSRIVAVGDSDFASNTFFRLEGNEDLFLNSVNWLTEEEKLITIRVKQGPRFMVPTQRELTWILYSSVAFFPLAVALVGALVWWRRR